MCGSQDASSVGGEEEGDEALGELGVRCGARNGDRKEDGAPAEGDGIASTAPGNAHRRRGVRGRIRGIPEVDRIGEFDVSKAGGVGEVLIRPRVVVLPDFEERHLVSLARSYVARGGRAQHALGKSRLPIVPLGELPDQQRAIARWIGVRVGAADFDALARENLEPVGGVDLCGALRARRVCDHDPIARKERMPGGERGLEELGEDVGIGEDEDVRLPAEFQHATREFEAGGGLLRVLRSRTGGEAVEHRTHGAGDGGGVEDDQRGGDGPFRGAIRALACRTGEDEANDGRGEVACGGVFSHRLEDAVAHRGVRRAWPPVSTSARPSAATPR